MKNKKKLNEESNEEIRKHIEETYRQYEERITKRFDEKIEIIKENLHGQINQVNVDLQEQSEMWEEKLGEVQKKNERDIKEINKEVKKQAEKNNEMRESDAFVTSWNMDGLSLTGLSVWYNIWNNLYYNACNISQ